MYYNKNMQMYVKKLYSYICFAILFFTVATQVAYAGECLAKNFDQGNAPACNKGTICVDTANQFSDCFNRCPDGYRFSVESGHRVFCGHGAQLNSTCCELIPTPTNIPTPTDSPNCGKQGDICDDGLGNVNECCHAPNSSFSCLPGEGRTHVCTLCTQGHGQSCVNGSKQSNQCCQEAFTCAMQPSGNALCLNSNEVINQPTVSLYNPCPENGQHIASCKTAIGTIPVDTTSLVQIIFRTILSLSGGVAIIMVVLGGYRLSLSQGNPEKVQQAREAITSAIVGLLFIIFSVTILQIIGIDILGLTSVFGR